MSTAVVKGHRSEQALLAMGTKRADQIVSRIKSSAKYEWLRVSEMKVDFPRSQRSLRRAWVKAKAPHFDPNQVGVIVVSRRRDGSLWIVDGQHRVELVRAVGWGDQQLYCEVFDGLTIEEEAALFLRRNDKVSVRTFDKFIVDITAKEDGGQAAAIFSLVGAMGLAIAESKPEGAISGVNALREIYSGGRIGSERDGAIALRRTLQAILDAWGRPSSNFQGQIIHGLGLLFLRYGAKAEPGAIVAVLQKIRNGAAGLISQAKQFRELYGGREPRAVAAIVVKNYNYRRRSGKLERWNS